DVGADLLALFAVEHKFFIDRMAFADVRGPLHGLNERWILNNLATQRRIEHPTCPDGNFARAALAASEIDFDANVSRANSGHANHAQKNNYGKHYEQQQSDKSEWNAVHTS